MCILVVKMLFFFFVNFVIVYNSDNLYIKYIKYIYNLIVMGYW